MKYDVEFEKQLIKTGYKKQWFSDKSGYWMRKVTKNYPFKGLCHISIVETDNKYWMISLVNLKENRFLDITMKYSKNNILKHKI